MNLTVRLASTVVLIAAANHLAADGPPAEPFKIKLGHDTTRIVEPLKPDGTPDYLAWLNRHYSEGVTPDNNAAVILFGILNPEHTTMEATRQRFYELLGIDIPEGGFFEPWPRGMDGHRPRDVAKGVWTRQEHPELVEWLERNETVFEKAVAASKRTRYSSPLVVEKPDDLLLGALLPALREYRSITFGLLARANLALGEGRFDAARADIEAACRLGWLVSQGPTLIDRLVGVAMSEAAYQTVRAAATSQQLSYDQCRVLIKQLASAPVPESMVSAMGEYERFCTLDVALGFSGRPVETITRLGQVADLGIRLGQDDDPSAADERMRQFADAMRDVDWNVVLRRLQQVVDLNVQAMQARTMDELVAKRELLGMRFAVAQMAGLPRAEDGTWDGQAIETERMANHLIVTVGGHLVRARVVREQMLVERDLTLTALALAAYQARHKRYPLSLEKLVLAYLDAGPEDFFSGKKLIYKRYLDGYVLYSVGENTMDDGGRSEHEGGPADTDDLFVQVGQRKPITVPWMKKKP